MYLGPKEARKRITTGETKPFTGAYSAWCCSCHSRTILVMLVLTISRVCWLWSRGWSNDECLFWYVLKQMQKITILYNRCFSWGPKLKKETENLVLGDGGIRPYTDIFTDWSMPNPLWGSSAVAMMRNSNSSTASLSSVRTTKAGRLQSALLTEGLS